MRIKENNSVFKYIETILKEDLGHNIRVLEILSIPHHCIYEVYFEHINPKNNLSTFPPDILALEWEYINDRIAELMEEEQDKLHEEFNDNVNSDN